MKRKWMRLISALMCLALLCGQLPAGADDIFEDAGAAVEAEVPAANPAGEPPSPADPEGEPLPTEVPAEATELPTEAPTEIPAETPTDAPTEAPDEAPEEPDAAPLPGATPEAEAEPLPEAAPAPGLDELAAAWMSALDAQGLTSEYARALWLYGQLIDNLAPGAAEDAAGALASLRAAPLGYARAYEALLRAAGIECLTVATETAAWNVARLDGAWTHIDVAADDAPDCFGLHFGLTDAAMAGERRWDAELPPCAGADNNYFVRERGYRAFNGREELRALLAGAAEKRAAELRLYSAGGAADLKDSLAALFAELGGDVAASATLRGCLAEVRFAYAEAEPAAMEPESVVESELPSGIAPEGIVPAADSLTLGVGETASVASWTMLPAGAQGEVTYASKSKKIATVSADGTVTGKKAGSTTITIQSISVPDVKCTVKVAVKKAPTSVSISADRKALGVGERMQLGCKLSSGSTGAVTFSIASGAEYATVTEDGLLTATAPGMVSVTAKTYNGKKPKKALAIEIKPAPTSVAPDRESISIGAGDSCTPDWALDAGSAGKLTFSSDRPEIASVDPDSGKIDALQPGEAVITADAYGAASGMLHVTVVAAPASVALEAERTTLGVKETLQLTPVLEGFEGDTCTLKYKSSKSSVASVNANGVVTAKKAGTATITVTTFNDKVKCTVKIAVKKAPTSVSISADRKALGVGERMQLGCKLSSGSAGAVTFSIASGAEYATVTEDGLLTATAPGAVSVTAKTYNGKKPKKALTIEIKPAPTSVAPDRDSISIGAGDSCTPDWALDAGSAGKLTFSSDHPEVASVDPDSGKIDALQPGEAVITADAYGAASGAMRVTVVAAPASVALEADRTTLGVKETLQLTPAFEGFEGDTCTLKFTSSKPSVASVSASGVVTAKKAGTANITAATFNGRKSAAVKLTVKKAPTSVSISADRKALGVGESMQLGYKLSSGSAGAVEFSAPEGQTVVDCTGDGLVTGREPGEVSVTVKTYNGKKKSATLEVKPAPTSIEILDAPGLLGVGATFPLKAAVNEGSAGELYYRVTGPDPNAAAVDADGVITALEPGFATLEVYTYAEGVTASAPLEVRPAPSGVTLPAASIDLGLGDSYQIVPQIDEGSAASFTYSSSAKAYATVSADGLVKPVKVGKAVITVKTHNKCSAKLTVNVKKKPTSVKASPAGMTLGIGESAVLGATLSAGSAATLRFASDDEEIASVAEDGTVTGVALGETSVTLTTHNGLSADCAVEVVPAPTALRIALPEAIGVGQKVLPDCALEPEGSHTVPVYEIASGADFAHFDKSGNLVADAVGTVVLRATCHVPGVEDEFTVAVKRAPTSISFEEEAYSVDIDGTLQLEPTILPGDSATRLTYTIKKKGYFTIDENGLVTPIKRGKSEVTVTTHNNKKATTTVWVVDPKYPEVLRFEDESPIYLKEGETYEPNLYIFPETAEPEIRWSSSNAAIASVDSDGVVHANSYGRASIKGKSAKNAKLSVSFTVIVLSDERCLVMPTHRTSAKGDIDDILDQIAEVKDSAHRELDDLVYKGWISNSERKTRQGYVDRAFQMYSFCWTPNAKKYYWKAANSEGGHKDFKKGTLYFGMPYTQSNRTHSNLNGYTTAAKDGYDYRITTNAFTSRSYPGSDCSSFCSMAIWGFGSGRKSDNTRTIASASYYITGASKYWADLRPGDLICKGGSHVVMFLYYVNEAHTQFVVIEQGGGGDDPYSNCVSTSIRDKSYYTGGGYKIRRVKGLDVGYKS